MGSTPSPFRFNKDFFVNDCHRLTDGEKTQLFSFLGKLQKNPYNPDFEEQEGFYAVEFSPGHVIYWKLVKKFGDLIRIEVLKIQSFKRSF
jgi:hypothetical protein